jgi:hypothetical protein
VCAQGVVLDACKPTYSYAARIDIGALVASVDFDSAG